MPALPTRCNLASFDVVKRMDVKRFVKKLIGYASTILVAALLGKNVIISGLDSIQTGMAGHESELLAPDNSQP